MERPRQPVLIIIPVYKPLMTPQEKFSLQRCVTVLGRHPTAFVAPDSLALDAYLDLVPGAHVLRFSDRYFVSTHSYSELMLSEFFYERVSGYEYILIYQLDAFVFDDQLSAWCAAGYDYVGAPWPRLQFRVGNGGFSLRRTAACLSVLRSSMRENAQTYWQSSYANEPFGVRAMNYHKKIAKTLGIGTSVRSLLKRNPMEDQFWSVYAIRYWPRFKIPPTHIAIMFAFEEGLRDYYQIYTERHPFGCHGVFNINAAYRLIHDEAEPESAQEHCVAHVVRSFERRRGL